MAGTHLFEFQWNGTDWVDEASYVKGYDIQVGFNVEAEGFLFEPIADVGIAEIVLDNASGRFSPRNSSGDLYGYLDSGVRFRFRVSGPTYFEGDILDIIPAVGLYGSHLCKIIIEDDIAKLNRVYVNVAPIIDHPVDDAVQDLVELAFTPSISSYQDNGDIIPVFGRQWEPDKTTVAQALKSIGNTFFGWLYAGYDSGYGIYYRTREFFQEKHLTIVIDNGSKGGTSITAESMEVVQSGRHVRNQINVIYHPEEELGSVVVLWETQSVLGLGVGRTRKYFMRYRDPNTGDKVASLDVEDFTATTDYIINTQIDGSGTDVTASPNISISFVKYVHLMVVTVTNNNGYDVFFTKMQCRGKPIIVYDPIQIQYNDSASQNDYGLRSQTINMITGLPQSFDNNDIYSKGAIELGELWLAYLSTPYLYMSKALRFNDTFLIQLFYQVIIIEDETGIDQEWHRVMKVRWHGEDAMHFTDMHMIPGVFFATFLLDDSTYGRLDENRLGA